ncbi:MAG TPA: hypothetical protein VNV41_14505 [Candidatus Acidoferrales bacterium]|jgi:hypothetical protein|nr:hypothetical protein [Candidatus Acidoferrales bacterium]
MATSPQAPTKFPAWIRLSVVVWLAIWIPAYWRTWGAANFLHLCDVAVILTCVGVLTNSALLISSQAISSLLVDAAWAFDAGWSLFRGRALLGGADYLFDGHYPLWVRLLSLFHIVMPVLLLWALYRTGYDRRGWALQCAIALPLFVAARFTAPATNVNYAFIDPFIHRQWGPAPIHVLITWIFMAFVVYLPTHLVLRRTFAQPSRSAMHASN